MSSAARAAISIISILPLFKIRRNNPQLYAPMAIFGNFLYVLEADEDDLISLIKYEIVGN